MSTLVSIGVAAREMGVHPDTLRRWEHEGRIEPAERTPGGRRRYDLSKIGHLAPHKGPSSRSTIASARVSTNGQKDDLVGQVALLESFCAAQGWAYEVITDVGSGLNDQKRGLRQLITQICSGDVGRLVLSHKDRLLRFEAELVFSLCEHFSYEVVILNASEDSSFEEDLASDVIEIVTVFSARLYGSKSHRAARSWTNYVKWPKRWPNEPVLHRREMVAVMKRTVRLATLPLNEAKYTELCSVITSYTDAKRRFVGSLRSPSLWGLMDPSQSFRDHAKAQGWYPEGMNVHLVDQAAFDAVDTCVRHIESCFALADLKARIWRRFADEDSRHYAYACLTRYSAIGEIMGGGVPEMPTVTVAPQTRAAVASYLHRTIRSAIGGTWPTVTQERSMALDSTLYSVVDVERPGKTPARRRYVKVVGATPHHRIVVPLAGISRVSGNIRVVLDDEGRRVFIHVAYDLPALMPATGPDVGIDWGITEVCTDDAGVHHGVGYGTALVSMTERRNEVGKARGKLWALSKKNAGSKRTRHIVRHNLGTKKQEARLRRSKAQLKAISGAAIKEVGYGEGNRTRKRGRVPRSPSQRPRFIIAEDLSHLRGKAKSKKISRMCAAWARSENKERITVHAYIGGSEVKTANAAYTSQTCPDPACGYVHSDNRDGDAFHCRNPYWDCTWQGDADHVAAMNIKARIDDREISRFTPYTEVKKILDERFLRRKENRNRGEGVVPGEQHQKTTAGNTGVRVLPVDGTVTAHGRTPSKPRGHSPVVGGSPKVVDSPSPGFMDTPGETQRLESEKKRSA